MQRHSATLPAPPTGPLGPVGEHLAAAHLRDDGLAVLETNWAVRAGDVRGELDLIAVDHAGRRLVVVEVKARRTARRGGPLAAVTASKQQRIRRLTSAWLRAHDAPYGTVRFDVIGLVVPRTGAVSLDHVPGAF